MSSAHLVIAELRAIYEVHSRYACSPDEKRHRTARQVPLLLSQKRVSLPWSVRATRAITRNAVNQEPSIFYTKGKIPPPQLR